RLARAARQRLALAGQAVESLAARLETLSPLNVLGRGYSLTRKEADQTLVRDPRQVRPGDRLVTYLQPGRLVSRVEDAQRPQPAGGPRGAGPGRLLNCHGWPSVSGGCAHERSPSGQRADL